MKGKVLYAEEAGWEILDPRANFKYIMKKEDMVPASVRMVQIKAGGEFPSEVHDESDEIGYLVTGKGKVFIEEAGEKEVHPGTFWYVPKGAKHTLIRVDEDVTLFCIHIPPAY